MNFGYHILHAYIVFSMGSDVCKLMLCVNLVKGDAEAGLSCYRRAGVYPWETCFQNTIK